MVADVPGDGVNEPNVHPDAAQPRDSGHGVDGPDVLPDRRAPVRLKPQIGHNIGFQAPIGTRLAWAPSRTRHTARDRWRGAENCTKNGPK